MLLTPILGYPVLVVLFSNVLPNMDRNDPAIRLWDVISQWQKLLADHQQQAQDDFDQLAHAHEVLRRQMIDLSVGSDNHNMDEVTSALLSNMGLIEALQARIDHTLDGVLHQIH